MAKEEKDKPEAQAAAVPASRYVDVECLDVAGYVPGARTTMHAVRAEELIKLGKAKLAGEESAKGNKLAPGANKK